MAFMHARFAENALPKQEHARGCGHAGGSKRKQAGTAGIGREVRQSQRKFSDEDAKRQRHQKEKYFHNSDAPA
jgi:hypothetical protein